MAYLVPQYDAYGLDSGLWMLYDEHHDHMTEVVYENLQLFMVNGTLCVWQFPDWDNETYDEYGDIDAE